MSDTMKTAFIAPDLGLKDSSRDGIVSVLTTALADEMVLYTRLRNYHWNVTGPHFRSLHELFEEQYDEIAEEIDEIAERIRTYGAAAIGTMAEFKDHARLEERPGVYPDAREMVSEVVTDHESMVRYLRADVEKVGSTFNDVGAEDFLTGLLQKHQEMAWMLRTYLEGPSGV